MRRECLTPQYSTKWHSLPSPRCQNSCRLI
ncbi:hypothetical protein LNM89_005070 [Escherichia coli]|nr:hypothetical protein [Escherichia coli]